MIIIVKLGLQEPSSPDILQTTVCPISLDPFYIVKLLHKMGQDFLDIQYEEGEDCLHLLLVALGVQGSSSSK